MDKVEALSLALAAVQEIREPVLSDVGRAELVAQAGEVERWLSDLIGQYDAE